MSIEARDLSDRDLLKLIRGIRFGSLEIVIHDSKVVQIIRTDKIRVQPAATSAGTDR